MFKYGLKLWSINDFYINDAKELYAKNFFDFIELFVVPDSFGKYYKFWQKLNIPFIIHAPHYLKGLNLSDIKNENDNLKLIKDTYKWVDNLKAEYIIFHPGINGNIDQTIKIIKKINDPRILIENMPYYALNNIGNCNGNSIEEINSVLNETSIGFCLDIGHAVYSANAQNFEYISYIKKFMKLNPKLIHLSDGDSEQYLDQHLNFGMGNFKIKEILKLLPGESLITIETEKKSLDDFVKDIIFLNNLKI